MASVASQAKYCSKIRLTGKIIIRQENISTGPPDTVSDISGRSLQYLILTNLHADLDNRTWNNTTRLFHFYDCNHLQTCPKGSFYHLQTILGI